MDCFEYSEDFRNLIIHLHRGKESWPNYEGYLMAHMGGPDSRFIRFSKRLSPEIEYHCGSLKGKRILDFGCGTGATTAALALLSEDVCAFDIDGESIDVCRKRIQEHNLESRVTFYQAADLDEIKVSMGTFDLILVNGVLEHIPLSSKGLRRKIVRSLFGLVRESGFLYITDSPNRLVPVDLHSTQLWWIPWSKPGSRWAFKRAVRRGRHSEPPTISKGPLGLEEVGAWGVSYWEIKRYLEGMSYECLNLTRGHDRRLHFSFPGSKKRRMLESVSYYLGVKMMNVPITAFGISITNLVFRKC